MKEELKKLLSDAKTKEEAMKILEKCKDKLSEEDLKKIKDGEFGDVLKKAGGIALNELKENGDGLLDGLKKLF